MESGTGNKEAEEPVEVDDGTERRPTHLSIEPSSMETGTGKKKEAEEPVEVDDGTERRPAHISIEASSMETGTGKKEAEDPVEVDDGTERRPERPQKIFEEFEKHSRNVTWLFDHHGNELRKLVPT